jgi:hypothetical protein
MVIKLIGVKLVPVQMCNDDIYVHVPPKKFPSSIVPTWHGCPGELSYSDRWPVRPPAQAACCSPHSGTWGWDRSTDRSGRTVARGHPPACDRPGSCTPPEERKGLYSTLEDGVALQLVTAHAAVLHLKRGRGYTVNWRMGSPSSLWPSRQLYYTWREEGVIQYIQSCESRRQTFSSISGPRFS